MRRIYLLSAVLIQIAGTVLLIATRFMDCGPLYVQCVQRRGALNIVTLATVFLLFWTGFFGAWNRIGALFLSGTFLTVILIADILFLLDGLTGSRIYAQINAEDPLRVAYPALFTSNYFIYNGWLLVCIGLVIAALYKTFVELRAYKLGLK